MKETHRFALFSCFAPCAAGSLLFGASLPIATVTSLLALRHAPCRSEASSSPRPCPPLPKISSNLLLTIEAVKRTSPDRQCIKNSDPARFNRHRCLSSTIIGQAGTGEGRNPQTPGNPEPGWHQHHLSNDAHSHRVHFCRIRQTSLAGLAQLLESLATTTIWAETGEKSLALYSSFCLYMQLSPQSFANQRFGQTLTEYKDFWHFICR